MEQEEEEVEEEGFSVAVVSVAPLRGFARPPDGALLSPRAFAASPAPAFARGAPDKALKTAPEEPKTAQVSLTRLE